MIGGGLDCDSVVGIVVSGNDASLDLLPCLRCTGLPERDLAHTCLRRLLDLPLDLPLDLSLDLS